MVRKVLKSFIYASRGVSYAFNTQINFKVHSLAIIIAIVAGFFADLNTLEWIAIITVIGVVLVAELFNTSIEVLVDLVSPEFNKRAGIVKDLAAGAVFVAALLAVIIGLLIFVPKFI